MSSWALQEAKRKKRKERPHVFRVPTFSAMTASPRGHSSSFLADSSPLIRTELVLYLGY